jgi:hypothetical protein
LSYEHFYPVLAILALQNVELSTVVSNVSQLEHKALLTSQVVVELVNHEHLSPLAYLYFWQDVALSSADVPT